jgi:hypothetical protein
VSATTGVVLALVVGVVIVGAWALGSLVGEASGAASAHRRMRELGAVIDRSGPPRAARPADGAPALGMVGGDLVAPMLPPELAEITGASLALLEATLVTLVVDTDAAGAAVGLVATFRPPSMIQRITVRQEVLGRRVEVERRDPLAAWGAPLCGAWPAAG